MPCRPRSRRSRYPLKQRHRDLRRGSLASAHGPARRERIPRLGRRSKWPADSGESASARRNEAAARRGRVGRGLDRHGVSRPARAGAHLARRGRRDTAHGAVLTGGDRRARAQPVHDRHQPACCGCARFAARVPACARQVPRSVARRDDRRPADRFATVGGRTRAVALPRPARRVRRCAGRRGREHCLHDARRHHRPGLRRDAVLRPLGPRRTRRHRQGDRGCGARRRSVGERRAALGVPAFGGTRAGSRVGDELGAGSGRVWRHDHVCRQHRRESPRRCRCSSTGSSSQATSRRPSPLPRCSYSPPWSPCWRCEAFIGAERSTSAAPTPKPQVNKEAGPCGPAPFVVRIRVVGTTARRRLPRSPLSGSPRRTHLR